MSRGWLPGPASGSLLRTHSSVMRRSELHASWAVTVTCTGTSLWLGGHNSDGEGDTDSVGGDASTIVATTVSRADSDPEVTSNVTSVRPTGNEPVGVADEGSSNTMPGADHANTMPSPVEAVPSRRTGVLAPV